MCTVAVRQRICAEQSENAWQTKNNSYRTLTNSVNRGVGNSRPDVLRLSSGQVGVITRKTCRLALALAEAVELGHGALHFFARGIGGRTDALDAQAEVVGIGRAQQSLFDGD